MTASPEKSEDTIRAFLRDAGWQDAALSPLAGDASTRSYMRAVLPGKQAVLMIAPPAAETAACPPQASPEERCALGYNACARLAGPNLSAFLDIARALYDAGLSAPEIYAADTQAGYALIEDLGDDLFARVVGDVDETTLYEAATDVLLHLHGQALTPPSSADYTMLSYDVLALSTEADLLTEWYWPLKKGAPIESDVQDEYAAIFASMIEKLSSPTTMVLRDYHAENLLWLPRRRGVARVGIIDFQDGLMGSPAYDLVSLLEDARRDVPPGLAEAMMNHYCSKADATSSFEEGQFLTDYAVLAAQRNAKILGIFARLAKRDGKTRYLDLLPRVEALFRRDLARPEAKELHSFFRKYLPELA